MSHRKVAGGGIAGIGSMSLAAIDYFAIVLATVASMIVGTIWYTAFAHAWQRAAERGEDSPQTRPDHILIVFAAELVMATVFALLLDHDASDELGDAMAHGLAVWTGFVATTIVVNQRFEGHRWELTVIDAGHWLMVILAQSAVLALI
ncbi:DUF1761 domain-containing protein [Jiella sp. MQZ9-1]|uniref:DUF1761 domain-containing protein n=1 Tax=Jiella flava TaxID=2816857 RepID=A0A939G2E3_9HYPH|nr:DUF1761 domain-containing protein [Jiella flava]MBO0664318.1 DUF1761 domain-containing protein [Jiella flava]MCD2472759.1 DUF1761 domain-containing protein [Jiella flava]